MPSALGGASPIRIQLLESLDALAPLADAWHALLEESIPGRGFFYRVPMLQAMAPVHAAANHPGGRRSPFFLLAWRGEQLVGGLPLVLERKAWSRAGLRRLLLWAGDGGALGAEGDLPLGRVAATSEVVADAISAFLSGAVANRFDRLECNWLRESSERRLILSHALRGSALSEHGMPSHIAELTDTVAAYRSSRSGSRIREIGRLARKLAAAHRIEWEEPDRLSDQTFDRIVELHLARQGTLRSKGWRRDTVFEQHNSRAAIRTLVERAASEGRSRHLLLLADGAIIGFLLGLRDADHVLAFLTGVDARFLEYGPDGLVFWEYVHRAFATTGTRRLEFGPGTTFVKATVSTATPACYGLRWDPAGFGASRFRRAAYDRLRAFSERRAGRGSEG